MDALRRAETPAGEATEETTDTVERATATTMENSAADLSLEPLNDSEQAQEDSLQHTDEGLQQTASGKDPCHDNESSDEPVTVNSGHVVLAPHSGNKQNILMFIAGLTFFLVVVGSYYAWKASELPAPAGFTSASLIDLPEPPEISRNEASRNEVAPATKTLATQKTTTSHTQASATSHAPDARPAQASQSTDPASHPKPAISIKKQSRVSGVNPELAAAYHAYQQQDFEQSEKLYKRVLRRYPDNRDAVLGLAAIAMYQGRYSIARYYYTRALKTNPADNIARIALHSLAGSGDSLKDGSRLKQWLQSDPDNPQLHFALGNYYAGNGQWKEAQHAYFEAFRLAPSRADYAFNLAVTLDRLALHKQALEYYRKARELAGSTPLFNARQLDRRIARLENAGEVKP